MTPDAELQIRESIERPRMTGLPRGAPATAARETDTGGARILELSRRDDVSLATGQGVPLALRPRSEPINRVVNTMIAGIALLLLAPLLLVIAVAIKLTSRGPVFYLQPRVGIDRRSRNRASTYDRRTRDLGGEIFTIYKFRSMRADAEKTSGAVWAQKSDNRVTAIGRFLRLTRLDELPQLLNVVLGDMNIVGPRPERPSIFARLREDIAEYPLRQRARPGITGWAQINQAYDSCIDDVRSKVRYDLEYLARQGVAEDLKIMARTLPVMIMRSGSR